MLGKYLDVKMVIPAIGFIAAIAVAHSNLQRVVKDVDVIDNHSRQHGDAIIRLESDMDTLDTQAKKNGSALDKISDDSKIFYGEIIELKTLVRGLKN